MFIFSIFTVWTLVEFIKYNCMASVLTNIICYHSPRDAPSLTSSCYFSNNKNNTSELDNGSHLGDMKEMIVAIKNSNKQVHNYNPEAFISPKVLEVMATIPRHEFVPNNYIDSAYENIPLSIGYNQTISQPYIVALMTSLLALNKNNKVLEIGTGSGYQTAILAKLASEVYTIEIIPELSQQAKKILLAHNYHNIKYACKNGKLGWKEYAPFDAIIVTAATKKKILSALITQLNVNGKLVVPLEDKDGEQILFLFSKQANNVIIQKKILPVRFVPMV